MDKLAAFKLQILKYTLIVAIIFEVGSLPFLGFSIPYSYGLLTGTCVSVLSFHILVFVSKSVVGTGKKWVAPIGYLLRLPMYGIAFYVSIGVSTACGIACLFGFMTVTVSMIYIHGIKSKFSTDRKVRPEIQAEFEREDRDRERDKELREEEE